MKNEIKDPITMIFNYNYNQMKNNETINITNNSNNISNTLDNNIIDLNNNLKNNINRILSSNNYIDFIWFPENSRKGYSKHK